MSTLLAEVTNFEKQSV